MGRNDLPAEAVIADTHGCARCRKCRYFNGPRLAAAVSLIHCPVASPCVRARACVRVYACWRVRARHYGFYLSLFKMALSRLPAGNMREPEMSLLPTDAVARDAEVTLHATSRERCLNRYWPNVARSTHWRRGSMAGGGVGQCQSALALILICGQYFPR